MLTFSFSLNSINSLIPTYFILQDAQAAIPKGTLLAILITGVTYIGVALVVCK